MTTKAKRINHTGKAYPFLTAAYDSADKKLFGGKLPPVLITLQRHHNSLGYFHGERFALVHNKSKVQCDEIAMNPMHFQERSPQDVLSTLVHEMCHVQQAHYGTKPSPGYHDRQWADMMEAVGLMPSATGKPNGKRTGPKMTHYIIKGGRFDLWCTAFLAAHDVQLYQDRLAFAKAAGKSGKDEDDDGDDIEVKAPGRVKFTCGGCELNAWAKPTAKLRCEECDRPLRLNDGNGEAKEHAHHLGQVRSYVARRPRLAA